MEDFVIWKSDNFAISNPRGCKLQNYPITKYKMTAMTPRTVMSITLAERFRCYILASPQQLSLYEADEPSSPSKVPGLDTKGYSFVCFSP
jgi:hypothetical protein